MKIILLVVLMLSIFAEFGCSNANSSGTSAKDSEEIPLPQSSNTVALPSFKVIDANNQAFSLTDFKGKMVFVNIWATWCPPCRAEIPSIERLYSKLGKDKVAFVLLSFDNDFNTAIKFSTKNKMTLPVFYPAENLPSLFNVEGIPATFIFDQNGNLVKKVEGSENYDTEQYLSLLSK